MSLNPAVFVVSTEDGLCREDRDIFCVFKLVWKDLKQNEVKDKLLFQKQDTQISLKTALYSTTTQGFLTHMWPSANNQSIYSYL